MYNTFILIVTFYFSQIISRFFKVNKIKIAILFIFRTIICLTYIPIAEYKGWDAFGYYDYAFKAPPGFKGTKLIYAISRFIQNYLHVDIYSLTFIFSFIGIIGCIAYISNIENLTRNADKRIKFLAELIIFLPTLNIWTSAIGKDAITFTCLNLIIFSFLKIKNRSLTLLLSCLIISLIRPFIGIVLFLGLAITFIRNINLPFIYKLLIRLLLAGGIILVNSINFEFLKLENLLNYNLLEIIDYYSERTDIGENAIDPNSLNIPMKIFSFMFRPLFIDAYGSYQLLMSFENMILILFVLYTFKKIWKTFKFQRLIMNPLSFFSIFYIPITWFFYSTTMMNLGTANRYKLMIVPILIPFLLFLSQDSKKTPLKI